MLQQLYGQVYIPEAVVDELRRSGRRFASFDPTTYSFLIIESPTDAAKVRQFEEKLDPGEAAALVLALEKVADYVLLDERAARRMAQSLGLTVIGVLGVLLAAKKKNLIPAIRPLIERLSREPGFHLSPDVTSQVLKEAGE